MQVADIAEWQVLRQQWDTGRAGWVIIPINSQTRVVDVIIRRAIALPRDFVIAEPAPATRCLPSAAANRKQLVQVKSPAHSRLPQVAPKRVRKGRNNRRAVTTVYVETVAYSTMEPVDEGRTVEVRPTVT